MLSSYTAVWSRDAIAITVTKDVVKDLGLRDTDGVNIENHDHKGAISRAMDGKYIEYIFYYLKRHLTTREIHAVIFDQK